MGNILFKSLTAVALGLFTLISSPQTGFATTPPLAIIDLQKALNSSEPGKRAMENLKSRMDAEYANLKKKEEELKSLEDLINRQGMLMKESEKREKEEEFLGKRKALERSKEDLRETLTRMEREMTQKIIKEIVTVTRKIGQEEGFSIIMEKGQGVIFAVDDVNITDKVIERYNSSRK